MLLQSIQQSERVQGGLLGDGLSSLFAAFGTSLPNTTFSQNNGVISLTRCASRWAGISAACWLLLLGVFAKVAAFITTIPDCVLGGMTTFLFANVMLSGTLLPLFVASQHVAARHVQGWINMWRV